MNKLQLDLERIVVQLNNLEMAFADVMKQYRKAKSIIIDRDFEIRELKQTINLQREILEKEYEKSERWNEKDDSNSSE